MWKSANFTSQGNNTKVIETNATTICQESEMEDKKEKLRILFTKSRYTDAELICHKLGGHIPLPTNEKDFKDTLGKEYDSKSFNTSQCKKLWLPIIQVCFQ